MLSQAAYETTLIKSEKEEANMDQGLYESEDKDEDEDRSSLVAEFGSDEDEADVENDLDTKDELAEYTSIEDGVSESHNGDNDTEMADCLFEDIIEIGNQIIVKLSADNSPNAHEHLHNKIKTRKIISKHSAGLKYSTTRLYDYSPQSEDNDDEDVRINGRVVSPNWMMETERGLAASFEVSSNRVPSSCQRVQSAQNGLGACAEAFIGQSNHILQRRLLKKFSSHQKDAKMRGGVL